MKIFFINTNQSWSEYAEQNLILASTLKKRGHHVFIALESNSKLNAQAWIKGLEILPIKSMYGLNPITIAKLSKFVNKNNINVVHIFNSKAISLGIKVTKKAKKSSLIVSHHPGFPAKLGLFIKKYYIKQPFYIILTSRNTENDLKAQQINLKRTHILPEGIDLIRYQNTLPFNDFYAEYSVPPEFFLIGCQSPASNKEDALFLLDTVEKVCHIKPNIVFLLFSSFKDRSFIDPIIQQRKLSEKLIIIHPHDMLPKFLSAIHMMIIPFHRNSYRCLILKAMAMAKPVIAKEYNGVDEIIQHRENGIIVKNKDPESLSTAIISLSSKETELKTLASNAREKVVKCFDIELLVQKLEKIYFDIINEL